MGTEIRMSAAGLEIAFRRRIEETSEVPRFDSGPSLSAVRFPRDSNARAA
jgi:hypothetical protein